MSNQISTTATSVGAMSGRGIESISGANGIRSKVALLPALAGRAGESVRAVVGFDAITTKRRAVLDALLAQNAAHQAVTEAGLLADALDAVSNSEPVPADLLARLVDARSLEYGHAFDSVKVTFEREVAAEYTEQVRVHAPELETILFEELQEILGDADRTLGALAAHGVRDAERAIETGLTEEWKAGKTLGERWLDAQRTRLWLSIALEVGFSSLPGSAPKLEQSRRASVGADCWAGQFEDTLDFALDDQPAEVLAMWVALPRGQRPAPMVEVN